MANTIGNKNLEITSIRLAFSICLCFENGIVTILERLPQRAVSSIVFGTVFSFPGVLLPVVPTGALPL